MGLLRTILIWVLDWAVGRLTAWFSRYLRRKNKEEQDQQSTEDVRKAQENAKTKEERDDAARKTFNNF